MSKIIKIILIVAVIALLGFVSFYFINQKSDTSSIDTPSVETASSTSFISTLLSLNKIKIDPTLFKNPFFLKLQDNTVSVKNESGVVGRTNPFAQIEVQSTSSSEILLPQINTNLNVESKNINPAVN